MSTNDRIIRLPFPLWAYLNQPLFSPGFKSLNPLRFWHLHNLEQLENAWEQSYDLADIEGDDALAFLEDCWLHSDSLKEMSDEIQFNQFTEFLEGCWVKEVNDPEERWDWIVEYRDESEGFY